MVVGAAVVVWCCAVVACAVGWALAGGAASSGELVVSPQLLVQRSPCLHVPDLCCLLMELALQLLLLLPLHG